ncbi:hypothetical protein IC235_13945 [Hymenobacter sp. BT664]|uniref:Uncharacterized protein n=1 Tax=Hymenobacter montanus TaxID=2771359 RepID=A0A927BEW9_9BACT|nr:hypothetical protein [Hymenobacter montanus]MBD2768990.1 hypothetical protein [Hymenobacter montanus]
MPGPAALSGFFFRRVWCAGVVLLAACSESGRSGPPAPRWAADSTTVQLAAGPHYARGAGWRFFWGTHYRALWATPITAPVLRLATAVPGGLTPLQAGGSYQSRTLRLRSPTGREFVLRSVDKDASLALPAGLTRRVLGRLMKDQTSATQPYGAYVAAELAAAAGVYHTNPRLVYMPDDPGLGPFRARFANALYLLEERAEGDQRAAACFGHSPAVVNTARMLRDISQRSRARVVARAYLRARLLDMWLGDWSRREDQWRWASFPQAGGVSYQPIPRDRDQAFFLFDDGLITRLVAWFVPKYHSFHATIRPGTVYGLTTTARALDRTLLSTLTADDYRQEADSLRRRLTDAVIAHALTAGPAETRAAVGARFGPLLRARREQLPGVAQQYYEILAKEARLVGTDQAERFVVSGSGPGQVRVKILACRPAQADSLLAERVYDRKTTTRINLYGLAGNDIFELLPPLNTGISVGLYDGAGHDLVLNRATSAASVADVTWYQNPDNQRPSKAGQVTSQPDRQPELTSNSAAWLKRYNLHD